MDGVEYATALRNAFQAVKDSNEGLILKNDMATFCEEFIPRSDQLSIAIFCKALEELGCPITTATPGTKLLRIEGSSATTKLVDHIYCVLQDKAGLVKTDEAGIIRTSVAYEVEDVEAILEDLLDDRPGQSAELGLMGLVAGGLAQCITGKMDPLQLLFGSETGRTLMADFYGKSALFGTALDQLALFFESVGRAWPKHAGPLRVLEVGAGTGGTTFRIAPVLARLGIPVVYTMSDIGATFGVQAQRRLAHYPFIEFQIMDIEKEPDSALCDRFHIVLGSNVLHATRKLSTSLTNVHKLLRSNGCLVLHELTAQMLWTDVIFGLLSGWWLFEDGRRHALQGPRRWECVLKDVGFDQIDWTDGKRPECHVQSVIFATALK
nr:citrinin polyketide synthase-like [Quercus suber]POF00347.1 non-reducing polyketide synthase azaa [Quercus suber]